MLGAWVAKMWKLLRNLLLAGVLVAGALKLLAWYEVGQDAERISVALAPYAQVHYDSVSAGLDGNVTFVNLSAAVKRDKGSDTYGAERVVIETPGIFWLLKHSLMHDNSLPAHFGVSVQGLKIPPNRWLDARWFNPATLVPFETIGCAAANLSPADYRKMDVSVGDVREHGEFRYDSDARTLDATVTLATAGIATLTLEGALRPFDPKMLQSGEAARKIHIEQLAFNYSDAGYFKRRNQFCSQRGNIPQSQFVEQHLSAVQELLQQHGVEPGPEVLKLYRRLVENGGQASILSLPNSGFVAGAWLSSTPEDLLRQMNVTARYGDAPPVMFRLNFPAPPQPVEAATAVADAAPAVAAPALPSAPSTNSAAPPSPDAAVPIKTIASATAAPSASTAPPVTPVPAPVSPPNVKPVAAPAQDQGPALTAVTPPATKPLSSASDARLADTQVKTVSPAPSVAPPAYSGNGLEEFDKAAAKLAPLPPRKPGKNPDFEPSTPPPPPGSTLALVWKPTIERLPATAPEHRDYDVIDFAALKNQHGRFVRLITEGGKKVEGYVVTADESDVQLGIRSGGGNAAQLTVPKARIQEIQLVHRSSPPA